MLARGTLGFHYCCSIVVLRWSVGNDCAGESVDGEPPQSAGCHFNAAEWLLIEYQLSPLQ